MAPPAATLKGGIGIVQGILQTNPTDDNTVQSVTIKVNGVDTVYNNTYIVGDPLNPVLGNGAPVMLVLQGSTPLLATFSQNALEVDEIDSKHPAVSQRTIPMSSAGQLQANFVMNLADGRDGVSWSWPSFTLNTLSFPNGASGKWSVFPSSFNLTMPTAGVNTQQTVTFPAGVAKPYHFQFHALGAAGELLMFGDGFTNPLTVSGSITGNSTVMPRATLDIGGAAPPS
jgi:hypothetical protein